ncbi:MAG: hypothetical protein UY94_C0023G0009 [Parcubacteria group bacterium GW2011_GWA2_56_21]|nr:MAG: hypothetical protein UY94_C0023G0009 [Parcubacteria group bacterium GW2011_GWA2_56_21]
MVLQSLGNFTHPVYERERLSKVGKCECFLERIIYFLPCVMHRLTISKEKVPFIVLKAISHSEAGETRHLRSSAAPIPK